MKQRIKIMVYENDSAGYEIPEKPTEFYKFFQKHIDKIPEAFLEDAHIEIEAHSEYDCAILTVEIYYYRLETDEEEKSRAKKELDRQREIEAKERAEFEKLKLKYGSKPKNSV